MVGINLSDGRLIPLNKLHIYLRKTKTLIIEWRKEGIEDLCFTIDSNSLQIWSEDVARMDKTTLQQERISHEQTLFYRV